MVHQNEKPKIAQGQSEFVFQWNNDYVPWWKHQLSTHTEVTSGTLLGIVAGKATPTSTPCFPYPGGPSAEEIALFVVYWLKAYPASCRTKLQTHRVSSLTSVIPEPLVTRSSLFQPVAL